MSPKELDKFLYVRNLQAWDVRVLYFFGIISWFLALWGFSGAVYIDPFYRYLVTPILGILTVYHLVSFGINLLYKKFDLREHQEKIENYWHKRNLQSNRGLIFGEPTVDIFLPICGENSEILKNTWTNVAQLKYANKKVYVLDDSTSDCEQHKREAEKLGFHYFERPNKGEMKKAGNLKYAYERTNGEFIAIFDADFSPHPDFLVDLLPYMDDKKVSLVQTPQYFDVTKESYKKSPLAYAAAYQEELFFRIIQVAKDRVGGAICCGTNAIYRREALKTIGGPRQVGASEDSRTGFALVSKGWSIRYVPVLLALGICPDNVYAYFHQQHRWCRGRSELVLSREFFTSSANIWIKICNISGFLAFLSRPLTIIMSFNLFWVVFFYNEYISFENAMVFYPYMAFTLVFLPLFHIARPKLVIFYAGIIQLYASSHALVSMLFGKPVGWIATGAKHNRISSAFKQSMYAVGLYLAISLLLLVIAFFTGLLRLFDLNYYSVQFWIFYNFFISAFLFTKMYEFSRGVMTSH